MNPSKLDPKTFFGYYYTPEELVKAHYREIYPQIEDDSPIFRNMDMVKEHFDLTHGTSPFYIRTTDCQYYVVI